VPRVGHLEDYPEVRWASQVDLCHDLQCCCGDNEEPWFELELEFVILLKLRSTCEI
jgi:hypothetical protein